jgi:hypothetical protein
MRPRTGYRIAQAKAAKITKHRRNLAQLADEQDRAERIAAGLPPDPYAAAVKAEAGST